MRGFDITSPGGGDASAVRKDPPLQPEKYQPRYNGERPSWGWFVRHAEGVTWENCTLAVEKKPHRKACSATRNQRQQRTARRRCRSRSAV